jgi:uncharacterized RDD family membrane protein YckC
MECPSCGNSLGNYRRRCRRCGATIPPGQYLLEESGVVERSAPITTAPARRSQRPTLRTARLGDRLIAAVLDSMVVLGAFTVISAWSFRKWGISSGDEIHLTGASILMAGVLSAAVLFLYLWLLEACFGATLGKTIVGIRVARITDRSGLAASAIRNGLRIVDGIGFYLVGVIVAGCSQYRQRLGDMFAGTLVVEETFALGTKLVAVLLWLAALTGAGWGVPRVYYADFSSQPPSYFAGTVVRLGYTADSAYLCISGLRIDLHRDPAPLSNGVATVDSSPR